MKYIFSLKMSVRYLAMMSCLFLFACTTQKKQDALFELVENTGINFNNKVVDNDTINILNYRNFYNGGGVAVGDLNNDGLPDVFFTANQGANKLYLNKGNFKFEDISTKAGFVDKKQFSTGVVLVDINNDGWLDIYVSNAGSMDDEKTRANQLFINNHDLTFSEKAAEYGLADTGYTTQATFFDYDNDGDLDCFLINNSPIPVNSLGYPKQRDLLAKDWKVPENLKGGGDHLYQNNNGHFTEVTKQAGIHGSLMSFGLGISIGDINGDHYPDIYVSNDFFERDYLYINQRNGTFKDELVNLLSHTSFASMGADIGDINNDGYPDIFTTDMLPADDYRLKTTLSFDDIDQYRLKERNDFHHQFLQNTLQLNTKHNKFIDISNYSGVNASEWSWGALMFDADNDGRNDIYICNGIYRDLTNQDFLDFDANEIKEKMIQSGRKNLTDLVSKIPSIAVPNKMFRNSGNLKFEDKSTDWGFTQNSFSNGAAYADLDNDGDLDLVINNVNEPALIYKNLTVEKKLNHYIAFKLEGSDQNKFAIGTKLVAFIGDQIISRELIPSRGFQSSMDYKIIMGIGAKNTIDSLKVYWPNNTYQKITTPIIVDGLNNIKQPKLGDPQVKKNELNLTTSSEVPLLTKQVIKFDKHKQPDYTDFYAERGIPEMLSHIGPKAAVGDVNGDGLEDVFVAGTSEQIGQLYLQTPNGFQKKEIPDLKQFSNFEDSETALIDADGDGDLDLFIAPGGNTATVASRELQLRLFLNDGKGNFKIATTAFPLNQDNIGAIVWYDFDGDGDLDLFTGAACVSKIYGLNPQSHFYLNDGKGHFKDLPKTKLAGINEVGMIRAATITNIESAKDPALVIVGEWMSPHIYQFKNGGLVEIKSNLNQFKGWWTAVASADVNNDGKPDLILGNIGENFNQHPTKDAPLKLFVEDFDGNGSIDKIMTKTYEHKDVPVFMKRDLQDQIPSLKKNALHHNEYAKKSINDLFSKDLMSKALVKEVNTASSIVAINKGAGQYELIGMNPLVQFSSIHSILSIDINKDGNVDLVLGGNDFYFQPQLGRLDANQGLILLGDGKGGFLPLSADKTGLNFNGMLRDIKLLNYRHQPNLLFLQNDMEPVLYKVNPF
jgi:hypothetical protein